MITIRVENVTEPEHRVALNQLLAGEFAYTPEGEQVDSQTFVIKFGMGEYGVVSDEILDKKHEDMMEQKERGFQTIYDEFPRTVNLEDGDEVTVSL